MAIKNKDGSVYRLTSPNPLARTQDVNWEGDIILHNCKWDSTVGDPTANVTPIQSDIVLKNVDVEKEYATLVEDLEEKDGSLAFEEVLDPTTLPVNDPPPSAADHSPHANPKLKNKVLMHCLPGTTRTHTDALYGDSYQKVDYGEKFAFESVIFEYEDMMMEFWVQTDAVTKNSIVYPYGYVDGTPFRAYRWWRITSKEAKAGGYLLQAVPSLDQPDFS